MIATLREVITYRFRSALSGGGFTGSTNHAFGSGWVTATARAGVLGDRARHDPSSHRAVVSFRYADSADEFGSCRASAVNRLASPSLMSRR